MAGLVWFISQPYMPGAGSDLGARTQYVREFLRRICDSDGKITFHMKSSSL